jgi:hypothetical protein
VQCVQAAVVKVLVSLPGGSLNSPHSPSPAPDEPSHPAAPIKPPIPPSARLHDLQPNFFRVFFGLAVFVLVLLLQMHLSGTAPSTLTAVSVLVSLVCGALAYWLAFAFVKYAIIFTPIIAIIGLLIAGIAAWMS